MTADELREIAATMRALGVFKLTLPDGVCIEMSQVALTAGIAEQQAKSAPVEAAPAEAPSPGEGMP
jgi:hypothetical protein